MTPAIPGRPRSARRRCCVELLRERGAGRIGLERSQGTQGADRMVGEPTVFWSGWFDGFDAVADRGASTPRRCSRARG